MSENEISFEKAMKVIKKVTVEARDGILAELKKDPHVIMKSQKSDQNKIELECSGYHGIDGGQNDRSMYYWITAYGPDKKEYELAFFYSEIDADSGNCHCQLGRLMFVKGLIKNPGSDISSPNIIVGKTICKPREPIIVFYSKKWVNPLEYISDSEELPKKLANNKRITVDDVRRDESVKQLMAKAFVEFILENSNADAK